MLIGHDAAVRVRNMLGDTPLHLASWGGYPDVVARLLLEHGADVEAEDNEHATPLLEAARNGKLEVARVLLEHGAVVHVQDNQGCTPLHLASWQRYPNVIRFFFLEHQGAVVHVRNKLGRTPLHETASGGYTNIIRLLLDGEDVEAKDNHNMTALHLAAYQGRLAATRELLKHGANAHARDNVCQTSFKIASTRGIQEIIMSYCTF
ncbi:ankyrin repeat-containing domain protein [Russula compacta]|nr:ankyrin repeat-containing domain protein [Russula compacta]